MFDATETGICFTFCGLLVAVDSCSLLRLVLLRYQSRRLLRGKLLAARWNKTEPRGKRPVHCPDCGQVNRSDKRPENWETYEDAGTIR